MSIAITEQLAGDLLHLTESLIAYINKRAFDSKELIQAVDNNQARLLIKYLGKLDSETKRQLGLQQLENWTFSGKPFKADYKAIFLMTLGPELGNLRQRFQNSTSKKDKLTARHELIFAVGLQGYLTSIANYQQAINKALTEQDPTLAQQLQVQFMKEVVQFESDSQCLANLLDNVKDCELAQIANELNSYLLGLKKQLATNLTSAQRKSTTKNLFAEFLAPIFANPLFTDVQYRKLHDKHCLLTDSYSKEITSLRESEANCETLKGQLVDNDRLLNDSAQVLNLGEYKKVAKQIKKEMAKYISAVKRELNKQKDIEVKLAYLNAEIETFIPLRKEENMRVKSFDPHELVLRELQVTLLKKSNKNLVKKLKRREKAKQKLTRVLLPHTKTAQEETLAYSYRRLIESYEALFNKAQLEELLKKIDALHKKVGQFSHGHLQQPSAAMRVWNRITRWFGYNQGKGAYYDKVSLPSRLTAWEQAYAKTVAKIQEKLAEPKKQNTKKADVGVEENAVNAKQYYQTVLNNTNCQEFIDNLGKSNHTKRYQKLFNDILEETAQFYARAITLTNKGFQQMYTMAFSQAGKLFAKDPGFNQLLDGEIDKEYFALHYILHEVSLIKIKHFLCAELEKQANSCGILRPSNAVINDYKTMIMLSLSWRELADNFKDESMLKFPLLEFSFGQCAEIMSTLSQRFREASLQYFINSQTQQLEVVPENESYDSDSEEQLTAGRKILFHHYHFRI